MGIDVFAFDGAGMQRVYENPKWTVGVKNWKPANDITGIDMLERHNETDELFVLLNGACTLLYAEEAQGKLAFQCLEMEPFKVYSIPARLWHNTITQKDTKLILIEDSNTGEANSDMQKLSADEIKAVQAMAR